MAARNPTNYTQWINDDSMAPGQPIVFTSPDQVVDDQEFCLDMARMIICDAWSERYAVTAVADANVREYNVDTKDICSCGGVLVVEHKFAVYGYTDADATSAHITVTTSEEGITIEVPAAAGSKTPQWWGLSNAFDGLSNGNEEVFQLSAHTGGAGTFYMLGLLIVAIET